MAIAIVKYLPGAKSVAQAISMCNGAKELKSDHKVLIKPNVVVGGKIYRNFIKGVLTTTTVLEEIIQFVREFGCTDISIGEGSVLLPDLGINTETAFEAAGITELARRYDVKLIDFYKHPFDEVQLGENKVEISSIVQDSDFIINVPVLKTHHQTRVSLSMKNLKGVLSYKSKKSFHAAGLEKSIALLGSYIKPQLNVVDGIYTVNKGPVSTEWQEIGVILAGTNMLAVDMAGTNILGQDPAAVKHLSEYAAITGEPLSMESVKIIGEPVEKLKINADWEDHWPERVLDLYAIKGVSMPAPGLSLCSGCAFGIVLALHTFFRECPGQSFDNVEMCVSGEVKASASSNRVLLFGKCAIGANKHIEQAIKIKGCPPSSGDCYKALKEHLSSMKHC